MIKPKLIRNVALSLSASLLTQPMTTLAYSNAIDEALEKIFDDLEMGEEIAPGVEIIENDDNIIIVKNILAYHKDLEIGDIVSVFGFGYSSSDGYGTETKVYADEELAIVGIKSDAKYPYALIEINEDGTLSDIVGWFPDYSIRARDISVSTFDYPDIKVTIMPKDDKIVNEEDSMDQIIGNQYYDLGEDYAVKAEYIWPEPSFDYDYKYTTKYLDQYQMLEFYSGDKIYTGYYDWDKGLFYYKYETRDKLTEAPILLAKRYNIKSN